jgi:dihydrofolate reductase
MKTILVFVSTLDGKITKWGNPDVKSWSSKQDQNYFRDIWNSSKLIVMGSSTYEADPVKPTGKRLVIVMTKAPEKHKNEEVSGRLEFKNATASELVSKYKKEGYKQMLVVGGPHIATSFLKEKMINEIWLTIEPKVFGAGGNFVIEENLDISLKLVSWLQANKKGTVFTKYKVIKS